MEKVKNDNNYGKLSKIKKIRILIISFRWFVLALITAYCFLVRDGGQWNRCFFAFFSLTVVYNALITTYIIKSRKKVILRLKYIMYIDVVIISYFTSQSGGVSSDTYLLLFFALGYYGIYIEKSSTLKAGLLSVIIYSFFSLYVADNGAAGIDHWRLIIRDIYLILETCGITIIYNEVRKYRVMNRKEFKIARIDKLTGLANRHYFEQKLLEEAKNAVTSGKPLSILIFDLDNFKMFNDICGHDWGDNLLTLFSGIIKQSTRESDILVRYGGEEFLILIRGIDEATAKSVGDRIRIQLEKKYIYAGDGDNRKRATVSCGIAQFPTHSSNIKEVIDLADMALYYAKKSGKNVVISFSEICKVEGSILQK